MKTSNTNNLAILQRNYNNAMNELVSFQRESAVKLKELKNNQMKAWAALVQAKSRF